MAAVTKARMLWQRLPTYFPNIKLVMYPLSETEHQKLARTGDLSQVSPGSQSAAAYISWMIELLVWSGYPLLANSCKLWVCM